MSQLSSLCALCSLFIKSSRESIAAKSHVWWCTYWKLLYFQEISKAEKLGGRSDFAEESQMMLSGQSTLHFASPKRLEPVTHGQHNSARETRGVIQGIQPPTRPNHPTATPAFFFFFFFCTCTTCTSAPSAAGTSSDGVAESLTRVSSSSLYSSKR